MNFALTALLLIAVVLTAAANALLQVDQALRGLNIALTSDF